MKYNTLYIIGNGFDLAHRLPTKYSDFHHFITNNNNDLEDEFENYFNLKVNSDYKWTNFEEDLGSFNSKSFYDSICNIDVSDEDFRPSFVFGLEDDITQQADELVRDIREAFECWLETIKIDNIKKKFKFEEKSVFVNFNYTPTLQEVYNIEENRILHIHGNIFEDRGNLIFGHDDESEPVFELDENGDSNRTMFSDSESASRYPFEALKKLVSETVSQNKSFFENIKNLKNIIVYGHSLNQIDIAYFEEINKYAKKAIWKVSFYGEHEKEHHLNVLKSIGIDEKKITMFNSESNRIVNLK